jgi:hypothetical protein
VRQNLGLAALGIEFQQIAALGLDLADINPVEPYLSAQL